MGITVRKWTKEDLLKVLKGDRWLTTLLANVKTVNEPMMMIVARTRMKTKTYYVKWEGDDKEVTTIYATDDEMLLQFLKADYTKLPTYVTEVVTNFRDVSFPQISLRELV